MNLNLRGMLIPCLVSIPFSVSLAAPLSETTMDDNVTNTAASNFLSSPSLSGTAQKDEMTYDGPLVIKLGTRIDYQRVYQKSDLLEGPTGFKGNNLMISIQGNLTEHFSYRFRQRISQTKTNASFFDGTDYMWLQYTFNHRWDLRAGKVAIEYGSTEYQRDPSEQYVFADYWNYPSCYLFGINLGYNITQNDRLVLQAAESPFRIADDETYSYALSWYGNHGRFHTMYTANIQEYRRGKFIYLIGLGNQLELGKFLINFDYMNRFTGEGDFWKDCTIRGEVMFRPSDHINLIALGVFSNNKTHDLGPKYLTYGSELTRFGGIVEYAPLPAKFPTLKMHAGYSYCYGQEGIKHEVPSQNRHLATVGVQWEMDIVDLAKKILKNI